MTPPTAVKKTRAASSRPKPPADDASMRQRLIAAINIVRIMLPVNPTVSISTLARQAGCDMSLGANLIALGYVKEQLVDGKRERVWASTQPSDEIADAVIVYRRKPAADATPKSPVVDSVAERRLEEIGAALQSILSQTQELTRRVAAVEGRQPQAGVLANDDRELVEMAINDQSLLKAQLAALDGNVTALMKNVYSSAREARDLPLTKLEVPSRFKVGVLGLYERDLRHVEDGVRAGLNGRPTKVELVRIEHEAHHHGPIPSGLSFIVVTSNAVKRGKEASTAYPHSTYHVAGGHSNVVNTILAHAGAKKP